MSCTKLSCHWCHVNCCCENCIFGKLGRTENHPHPSSSSHQAWKRPSCAHRVANSTSIMSRKGDKTPPLFPLWSTQDLMTTKIPRLTEMKNFRRRFERYWAPKQASMGCLTSVANVHLIWVYASQRTSLQMPFAWEILLYVLYDHWNQAGLAKCNAQNLFSRLSMMSFGRWCRHDRGKRRATSCLKAMYWNQSSYLKHWMFVPVEKCDPVWCARIWMIQFLSGKLHRTH